MRELAQTRVRFGYRRLRVMLQREGWTVGKERFYRVYTEEGLALRRKRPWRHATAVHREQRRPAIARNDIWSMDFVADQLADGRRFRALTVHRSVHARVLGDRRRPGPQRAGRRRRARAPALRSWAAAAHLLRQRNGVRQRRDGSVGLHQRRHPRLQSSRQADGQRRHRIVQRSVPEKCLNVHWFASLEDAQQKIDAFRWDYNEHHPHRAQGPEPSGIRSASDGNRRELTLVADQKPGPPPGWRSCDSELCRRSRSQRHTQKYQEPRKS